MGNKYQCQFIPSKDGTSLTLPPNTYISKLGVYAPPFPVERTREDETTYSSLEPVCIEITDKDGNKITVKINTTTYMYEVSNVYIKSITIPLFEEEIQEETIQAPGFTDKLIIDYILEEEAVQNG